MAICKRCGQDIPGRGGIFKHMRDMHPEDFKAMQNSGLAKMHPEKFGTPADKADAIIKEADKARDAAEKAAKIAQSQVSLATGDKAVTKVATSAETASFFSIVPKTFSFSAMLLQMTKRICETEWGWPEMDMGDFLDTYLFWTMKQRGVEMGGYQILGKNGNGGNGHHEEAPDGSQERVGSGSAPS